MVKEKFQVEYEMHNTSLQMLWAYIGTPSGLDKWFCDKVEVNGKKHTFFWQRTPQNADLLLIRQGNFIRFRWEEDANTKYYFELKINVAELSGEIELEITDFAYPDEKEEAIELWNTQIDALKRSIGV